MSAATAWEAGIQAALGRLRHPSTIEAGVEESGFEKLSVSLVHAERAARLPKHHGDPCDRVLVAQAEIEELTIVANDRVLGAYEAPILWA